MAQTRSYGRFDVESETNPRGLTDRTTYYVTARGANDRVKVGDGKQARHHARTLAAALAAAGEIDLSSLPPEFGPRRSDENEWAGWAGDTLAVPATIAAAGNAPLAGYLKVVHRQSESWIAREMDVSETTVRQYLSDLREGRR